MPSSVLAASLSVHSLDSLYLFFLYRCGEEWLIKSLLRGEEEARAGWTEIESGEEEERG